MSRKIKIKIQEQIDRNQLNSIVDGMDIDAAKGALKALSDEQLNQVVAYLADPERENQLESLLESFTGLTEEIIIEHKFYNLYDALQDAVDENGEKPCPQCLYEVLLGQSEGPRMGSFFALYGRGRSVALMRKALDGGLAENKMADDEVVA